MDYLLYAFYIVMLLFWIRIWAVPAREFYFNPFLSGTVRLTDSVLTFLRPVLMLPEQIAALVVMLVILLFKTLLFWRLGECWSVIIGEAFEFTPRVQGERFAPFFVFSLLQAAVFIIRLWTVYLLVRLITPRERSTRATEALAFFSRPFSLLPFITQPLVLLALHVTAAFALPRLGLLHASGDMLLQTERLMQSGAQAQNITLRNLFLTGPLLGQLLKTCWLAAISIADGLMFLMRLLIILIIGNIGAALLQARGLMIICNEGVELLLGRFARRNPTAAGLDFTPLIFFFVVSLLYNSICRVLYQLIHSPFVN